MSELADEMARRMEPEHLKELASTKVTEFKELARERATEKVDELKTHAKEAVMRGTTDIKERADTPRGWSMLGAIIGAGVGSVLMKKAFDVRRGDRRMYGEYDREMPSLVPAPEGGLMRPTGDKVSGLRERIPDRYEMRQRTSDWYDTVVDNPVLLAIGGIAIGALFASFIPVTSRERKLIEPAKAKVKESISNLGEQLESKLSEQSEDVSGREDELRASASSESESERGRIPPLPPLDDYTSVH